MGSTTSDQEAGYGIAAVIRGGAVSQFEGRIVHREPLDALPVKESTGLPYVLRVEACSESGKWVPVSHACGRDCHMAVVLAAAHVLASPRDALPGDVLLMFQLAEEGTPLDEVGGAQAMLDAGAFQAIEPTMLFGMHLSPLPRGVAGYRSGVQFAASSRMAVTLAGSQAHAAMPWLARDPLLAAAGFITAAASVTRTIEPTRPATVAFDHVEDIGRYNVIGDKATCTVRCAKPWPISRQPCRRRPRGTHRRYRRSRMLLPSVEWRRRRFEAVARERRPRLGMDTRSAVRTTVFGVNGASLGHRPLLLGLAFSRSGKLRGPDRSA